MDATQLKAPLLFADFVWSLIKSMAYDVRWVLFGGCMLIAIMNIQSFFREAPEWGKALFSFYVFSRLAAPLMKYEAPSKEVLRLKRDVWLSSITPNVLPLEARRRTTKNKKRMVKDLGGV